MNTLFTFVKRTYVHLLMCAVLVIVAMPLSAQNISSGTANQQITGLVTDDKRRTTDWRECSTERILVYRCDYGS